MEFGACLNRYKKIDFLEAISIKDLVEQIRQLEQEVEIVAVYAGGSKHYALINVNRPILKKKKLTKKTR